MDTEISAEAAAQIISNAFAPLHCGAEEFDFHRFVRFRVFDKNDEGLLRMEKLTSMDYGTPKSLKFIIDHARANLTRRGYALDPWEMPPTKQGAT